MRHARQLSLLEPLETRRLLAFTALINFQPANAPSYPGYMKDSGAVFGNRGNGFSYGWNATNNNAVDRNSKKSPDQRYDTFMQTQKGGNFTWEIAVPNGTYNVRPVAGDPASVDAFYHIMAEGRDIILGKPSSPQQMWLGGNMAVNVTDGRLTISNGSRAVNNKINFIEITQAAPAPAAAPAAPSNLQFSVVPQGSANEVTLTWTDNSNNEDKFIIEQKGGFFTNFFPIKEVAANVTSATVIVGSGQQFEFRVRARNAAGDSAPSESVIVRTRPAAPDRVYATTISSSIIQSNWESNGSNTFDVQRLDGGVWVTIAAGVVDRTHRDTGLAPSSTHSYRIIAVNDAGRSDPSLVVSATTAPLAPANLRVTDVTSSTVSLAWDDVEGETGYFIERSLDGITWSTVGNAGGNGTTFTDTGLTSGTTYFYRVLGFTNVGFTRGDTSDPVSAHTL